MSDTEKQNALPLASIENQPAWKDYLLAAASVGVVTVVAKLASMHLHHLSLIMLYLLAIVFVSLHCRVGPSIFASALSVLTFDLLFLPTNGFEDLESILTLGVMLFVALLINTMAMQIREQAKVMAKAKSDIETERMRNALLSSVSHDFRTPLSAITGSAGVLLDESLSDSDKRQLYMSIYDEAERLNQLVTNLLDTTRLESGSLRIKKEWNSMQEIVGVALDKLKNCLSEFQIKSDIPNEIPLVKFDASLIHQVLVNLLDNARKYAPKGSLIHITAKTVPGALQVEISNTGSKLQPGEEQKIFEKFYRSSGQATTGGTGLGLTICRGIVHAHNGRIWAESRDPAGTAFIFTLPMQGSPPAIEPEK